MVETDNVSYARYSILSQHRQYLDKMFWSRVQVLHAIQAGVLAAGYLLRNEAWYAEALFSIGALLTFFVGLMAWYDWQSAEANKEALYELGDRLGIRWSAEKRNIRRLLPGHVLLYIIIILFILADGFCAIYF